MVSIAAVGIVMVIIDVITFSLTFGSITWAPSLFEHTTTLWAFGIFFLLVGSVLMGLDQSAKEKREAVLGERPESHHFLAWCALIQMIWRVAPVGLN